MPDIPGNSSTTSTVSVGGSLSDNLETAGDRDWVRVVLDAGEKVTISLTGLTLEDAYLRVRDSAGNLLAENDDISTGVILDSKLVFTAPTNGVFFIEIGAYGDNLTGTYRVNVDPYTPPPVATYAAIASHLTHGYWGGASHHFDVAPGGTITVNLQELIVGTGASGANLAREALGLWSDITGINFVETVAGAQITFIDNREGAFSEAQRSGGITSSALVNVSTQWLADYGTSLTGYSFLTYIHEIGHALGLGHGGYYNGEGNYANDAIFANDGWPVTIMSYFDQRENDYFATQGFTKAFLVTPMIADVRGMATLYGLSSTTRTGDTTYGFNNTSGRSMFNAVQGVATSYTIYDSGGIDTLDYSQYNQNQRIDLTPESFSNVGSGVGNVSIAFNTLIENAIGGNGIDVIRGNSANNVLTGGGQPDTLTGAGGDDTYRDTAANLNGDTITDFTAGDRIVISDANPTGFAFNLSGSTLTFSGALITLSGGLVGALGASAAPGGGVQLTVQLSPVADVRNDFNGDGRSDVMWRNDNGVFSVWQGTSNGGFTASALSDSTISVSWRVVGSGDFNGDGRDDVLWRHDTGAFSQWLGLANGGFVANAAADAVVATDWQVAATGDFNGDLRDDVIWRSNSGGVMGWFGQANGSFATNPLSNTSVSSSWKIVGAGDSNGDGRDDIVWRNDSGAFSVWHGQGNGGFVASPNSDTVISTSWHVNGIGDFNGDGRDDVLWRNDNGAFSVWHGQGNGGFVASPNSDTVISTSWRVAGTGDFNGDGRDDVLWRNDNGAFSAWHGQADGGFVASPNSNTVINNSWHVQSPDIYLL